MPQPDGNRAPIPRARRPDDRKGSRIKIGVSVAFAALVSLAGFVVFFLPSRIAPPPITPSAQVGPLPPGTSVESRAPATRGQDAEKPVAEGLLADALRRLTRLESEGVRTWGIEHRETSLLVAEEALAKARAHFDRQQYAPSLPLFREAIAAFDRLTGSVPERFRVAMERGRKAFDELDAPMATREFEVAVALMPGNPEANSYLDRARKLPEVLSDVAKGQEHETAGNLDQARASYQNAASRDTAFAPAQEHLARANEAIAARDYRLAVSEALGRLDKQDFKGASDAAQRARKIRPNAPELTNIVNRIQISAQSAALEAIHRNAAVLETQERWPDALNLYRKALAIDKRAAFAVRGRARAETFVELHRAIDAYLAEPIRLQSPEPLAHAKTLLAESAKIGDAGAVLQAKTKRLQEKVSLAEKPIPILMQSDRNTDVTIYRIGRIGTFETHRLELRPGNYTAVGSRPGFRDVRVEFRVAPATNGQSISILCTEPIQR